MDVQKLLQEVTYISQKYDLLNRKTGRYFNVFEITGTAADEVAVCRVLAELLSPQGSHCQGTLFLSSFARMVLGITMTKEELAKARVYREYAIDSRRRIDLVIETEDTFLPIEVKIFAGEQRSQCYDYYQEARRHVEHAVLYYLTRFGDSPSPYSAKGLTRTAAGYEEIVLISFAEHILPWLSECVRQTACLRLDPIREVLLQLMAAIRKFTSQMEDEKEMEIQELLLSSPEQMKSAVAIQNCVNKAKEIQMIRFFRSVEEKVGREYIRLSNEYDYAADNFKKIREYYRYQRPSWPGISYLYKSAVKEQVDVWVRLEIDWRPYVGYCCPQNGKALEQPLSNYEIETILEVAPEVDNWWAYWEFCPQEESQSPNFKGNNELWYQLFDPSFFEAFTSYCAERIRKLLAGGKR